MSGLTNTQKKDIFVQAAQSMDAGTFSKTLATAATIPIAEQVIEQAKFRQLLETDRFDNGPAITYNLKKRNSAVMISKYGAPPTHLVRYTSTLVTPWLITHKPAISILDIRDGNFNVVTDILDDAGNEVAAKEDIEGFRLFNAAAALPGSAWPNSDEFPTAAAGAGGIGMVLSANTVRLKNGETPTVHDVINSQSLLRMIGYEANGLLMNPYTLGKLMVTNEFLTYMNFGARDVMERGYVESALGVSLVTSRLAGQRDIWVLDSGEAARFIERDPLTMDSRSEDLIQSWLLWERVAIFVKNANAMIRIAYQES